jgi:hypothetical protein
MFKLATSDRMDHWKSFRSSLDSLSLDEAITQTVLFWQSCPFIPFYLMPEDTTNWPDPWELIAENYYCDLAKALGMLYTIHLSSHYKDIDPEIRVYYDSRKRVYYHIAYLCQGKYVLNLVEGEVVNKQQINQQLKLKYCYTAKDLKLEQY